MSLGPSGSGGSGSNPNTAQVYLPPNQAGAASNFWTSLGDLSRPYAAGMTPGQMASGPAWAAATNLQPGNNPYADQALNYGTTALNYGQGLLGNASSYGNAFEDYGGQLSRVGNQLTDYGEAGLPYGNQLLQTAFDPQNALYNRQVSQLQNQQNAQNAMSGIAGTPYGAGITGQTLSNFDIDWQNQQLQRQLAGAQGYGQLGQSTAGILGAGANLDSQGLQAQLYGAELPYQIAQKQAGLASNLANTYAGQNQNALNALAQYTNIGNQLYAIPQQIIGDVMQYMGLGQNASQLSGQLGQMGVNQLYQGLGGVGSLLGLGGGLGSFGTGGGYGLTAAEAAGLGIPGASAGTGFLGGLGDLFGGIGSLFGFL